MADGKTLPEMQAIATSRVEAIIGAWTEKPTGRTRDVITEYKHAYREIDDLLKGVHTRILSGLKPEDYFTAITNRDRLTKLQKSIAQIYRQHANKAGRIQAESGRIAMTNKYYDDMFSMNQFLTNLDVSYFSYIDQKAVEVSVFGTPEIWHDLNKQAKARLRPYQPKHGTLIETLTQNKAKDLLKIRQSITQALIQGTSYTKTTKQIQKILETSASNALRIARTEGMRNMNSGSYADSQAAQARGIEHKRRYVAVLDNRTREQSSSMDGQEVNPDEPFTYPNGVKSFIVGASGVPEYDINDRCEGIKIIEGLEPEVRTAKLPGEKRSVPISYIPHKQWMKDNGLKFNNQGKIVQS